MNLELKYFKPYLLQGVKCSVKGEKAGFELVGISDNKWIELHEVGRSVTEEYSPVDVFMHLRPLSDLTKEIEYNGVKNILIDSLLDKDIILFNLYNSYSVDYKLLRHGDVEKLFKYHFDVFGLIDKGLAIDINTL